jgi:hypothetical protein
MCVLAQKRIEGEHIQSQDLGGQHREACPNLQRWEYMFSAWKLASSVGGVPTGMLSAIGSCSWKSLSFVRRCFYWDNIPAISGFGGMMHDILKVNGYRSACSSFGHNTGHYYTSLTFGEAKLRMLALMIRLCRYVYIRLFRRERMEPRSRCRKVGTCGKSGACSWNRVETS